MEERKGTVGGKVRGLEVRGVGGEAADSPGRPYER